MTLTNNDAKIILGMVARGDKRHDIAAWFGENQARITEVEQGEFGNLTAAPSDELPPKGPPGLKGRRLVGAVEKALHALEEGQVDAAKEHLARGVNRFNQNE